MSDHKLWTLIDRFASNLDQEIHEYSYLGLSGSTSIGKNSLISNLRPIATNDGRINFD